MWLTCSTVGRKFIMAVSGAVLVLFVTFHCCMNSIAICWPAAYNSLCEFLGANWYALIASVGLALFILLHIVYACWLTIQNRKARGPVAYAISKKPKTVEWSSKNMLVLGVVILAFLVVHLIQFWAKMQLQEIRGVHDVLPPAAGTLFLQEAFQTNWTWIVYIAGFIALWFHLNHGIWSMFQSVGWDNKVWIERFKKLAIWWSSIVCLVFIAQAIVFTAKAHEGYFKNDPVLREQYKNMMVPMFDKDFGPDAAQYGIPTAGILSYEEFGNILEAFTQKYADFPESLDDPRIQLELATIQSPKDKEQYLNFLNQRIQGVHNLKSMKALYNYLNGVDAETTPAPEVQETPAVPSAMYEEETIEGYSMPADADEGVAAEEANEQPINND